MVAAWAERTKFSCRTSNLNYKGFLADRHFVAVLVLRHAGLDQVIVIYIVIYTDTVPVRRVVVHESQIRAVERPTHVLLFDQGKRSHIDDARLLSAVVQVGLTRCGT